MTAREEIELHPAVGELIVKMRAELAEARATIDRLHGVIEAHTGEVARLEFALQCEATRHETTRAAVQEYLAAEAASDAAHVGSLYVQGERDSDEVNAAADRIVAAIKVQDAARKALRKIVEGDHGK